MKLQSTNGSFSLTALKGSRAVLYFYPRNNTAGCTQEGKDFAAAYACFQKLGVEIFGISTDPLASHEKFRAKYGFPFVLVSDPEKELSQKFGVIKLKAMYGRKFEGIERSTFLLGENGRTLREWRAVKVPGHVAEVLACAEAL